MGADRDIGGSLVEVKLHRLGVGEGQRQGGADPAGRADRAEQIGTFVALVGRLARSRSPLRPLAHEAVLLADAGLVLEPNLDRRSFRQFGQMRVQGVGEVFLKASTIRPSWAG